MKKFFWFVVATFALISWADTPVTANQGKPGNQGPWPVTIANTNSDGGTTAANIATSPRICAAGSPNANTTVGGTAAPVPTTANASRIYVVVCNSAQNASTAIVKCRADNTAPVFAAGNAGDVLLFGDCLLYSALGSNAIQCIADAAGRNVTTYECVPQ